MTMGKFISNLFLGALAIGLSIFTGSRTLDLLAWALPANQVIYQWLGLAAFEGGMYFWSFFFISGAKGTQQRSISLLMAVFSLIAVCIATVMDLSLGAAESGKLPALSPTIQQTMIIFVGIVVALNVAAFLACHLLSPEKLREIKSGQAEDMIYSEGLRAIEALAPSIAADAAPHLAAEWSNRTWQKIVPGVPRRTEFIGGPAGVPALPPAPEAPLYRDEQRERRAAPSAGLPLVPDEETALARQSIPSKIEKKPGFLSKAKGFLGGFGGGKQEEVSLTQTAPVSEVAPERVLRGFESDIRRTKAKAARPAPASSSVAAARRARRAARFHSVPEAVATVATTPAGPEHRTCSECGTVLELRNAKQLTCSPACRQARARRLASEKRGAK